MRKFCIGFVLAIMSTPAWATWTQVQLHSNLCTSASTCTVTMSATTSGDSLVAGVQVISSTSRTLTGVSGGGTWALCGSACEAGANTIGFVDMATLTSVTGGTTSVSVTLSGSATQLFVWVWEFSSSLGSVAFDDGGANYLSFNCTSCTGTGLVITGSNDVIATVAIAPGGCNNSGCISSPYTNDETGNEVLAHALNTTSGIPPTWTQTGSQAFVSAAIALKETPPPPAGHINHTVVGPS